jgi:hypothetical protein
VYSAAAPPHGLGKVPECRFHGCDAEEW